MTEDISNVTKNKEKKCCLFFTFYSSKNPETIHLSFHYIYQIRKISETFSFAITGRKLHLKKKYSYSCM